MIAALFVETDGCYYGLPGVDITANRDDYVATCHRAIDALNRALNGGESSVWGEPRQQVNAAIGKIAVLLEQHCAQKAREVKP